MHLNTMFISTFYDAIHFWCCDVLFFNLQATSATEWKYNSSIMTCHHNNYTIIVQTESTAEGLMKNTKSTANKQPYHLQCCCFLFFFNGCQTVDIKKGNLSTVFLIIHQPQIQLIQLGTEKRVHILYTEGRFVFREAPASRPGRWNTCLSNTSKWLLWSSGFTNFKELQESLDAPLAKPGLRTVLAI